MNEIELLRCRVENEFPRAETSIDAPKNSDGWWWLDIRLGKRFIVVQWALPNKFGVSDCSAASGHVYGERADMAYDSADDAFAYITQLLE